MVLMQEEAVRATSNIPVHTWWRSLPRKLRRAIFVSGVAAALALAGTGVWLYSHRTQWPDPQLVTAAQAASYPIYYPTSLPAGFIYNEGSAKYSANVFIYTFTFDGNKKLFVSTIPKPDGVQFSDFYNRILSNKTEVLSNQGTAVMGNAGGQTIGSLVTDKSWITMNTSASINSDTLKALLSSLKKLPS